MCTTAYILYGPYQSDLLFSNDPLSSDLLPAPYVLDGPLNSFHYLDSKSEPRPGSEIESSFWIG